MSTKRSKRSSASSVPASSGGRPPLLPFAPGTVVFLSRRASIACTGLCPPRLLTPLAPLPALPRLAFACRTHRARRLDTGRSAGIRTSRWRTRSFGGWGGALWSERKWRPRCKSTTKISTLSCTSSSCGISSSKWRDFRGFRRGPSRRAASPRGNQPSTVCLQCGSLHAACCASLVVPSTDDWTFLTTALSAF